MATHSSLRAWRTPGTEEPDGLQRIGREESDTAEVSRRACAHADGVLCCLPALPSAFTVLGIFAFSGVPCLFLN